MSLAQEARELRDRVIGRLVELEPLAREYAQLRDVVTEMGLDPDEVIAAAAADDAPREPLPPPAALRSTDRPDGAEASSPSEGERPRPRRPRRRRSGSSELQTRILAAVERHPGATVAEYADELGVAAAKLYRPVRELTDEGALVKRGRQLSAS